MPWSSPKTWNFGYKVKAQDLNTEIRDKLNEIWKFVQKGDLWVALSSTSADRLPVGADGQVLIADSNQAMGMRWGSIAPIFQFKEVTTSFQTNSTTPIDYPNASIDLTLPAGATYIIKAMASGKLLAEAPASAASVRLVIDGTAQGVGQSASSNSTSDYGWRPYCTVFARTGIAAGTRNIKLQAWNGNSSSNITVAGVSLLVEAYPVS